MPGTRTRLPDASAPMFTPGLSRRRKSCSEWNRSPSSSNTDVYGIDFCLPCATRSSDITPISATSSAVTV